MTGYVRPFAEARADDFTVTSTASARVTGSARNRRWGAGERLRSPWRATRAFRILPRGAPVERLLTAPMGTLAGDIQPVPARQVDPMGCVRVKSKSTW